jgi:acetyl-CoA C-acetyltransferase
MTIKGKAYIAGAFEHPTRKADGKSLALLHAEVAQGALADAGLTKDDVDGYFCAGDAPGLGPLSMADYMGLKLRHLDTTETGGSSYVVHVGHAAEAIAAGKCRVALVTLAGRPRAEGMATGTAPRNYGSAAPDVQFEYPFGPTVVNMYAMAAQRHMHEFGTTSEDLAHVAVATRKHACMNANATMRKPMTIADHQASRFICEPLRLFDCALESDGGGAVIVTRAERAHDFPKPAVAILGMGQHHPHFSLMDAPSLTTLGGRKSSALAYAMAGLGPQDMDFAEIYDCFTITTLITLEDYGFCAKGEGKDFVKHGRIEIGGALPVNTHGGLLSQAHIEGMLHVTEAAKQLRGNEVEPGRQVKNAEAGIVSGHGGSLCMHATLILGAL